MLKEIKDTCLRLWSLVIEAPETWDIIAMEETNMPKIRKQYIFTPIVICAILSFLFTWLSADIQHAIVISLRDIVVLTGGYFIVCWLCRTLLERQYPNRFNAEDSNKVVSYCYTYIIILQIFISIVPHSTFLYLLDFFVAYLLWEAANSVFALDEDERQSMVLTFTIIIVAVPITLAVLLNLIVLRNIF